MRNWGNVKPPPGTPIDRSWVNNMGLVAGYFMQDGAGGILQDSSNHKNHGTLEGGVLWTGGKFGSALAINGTDGYVAIPNDSFDNLTSFTIITWCKFGNPTHDEFMFLHKAQNLSNSNTAFWRDHASTDHYAFLVWDGINTTTAQYSAEIPRYNEFVNLVLVFIGGLNTRLYINGKEDASSPFDTSAVLKTATMTGSAGIGGSTEANRGLLGGIDHITFYNKALSLQEIIELRDKPFSMFSKHSPVIYSIPSGGTTPVNDTLQLVYNVRKVVSDDLALKYNVNAKIADTLQIIHNIRTKVNDVIDIVYNVRAVVNDSIEIKHNINAVVSDSLQLLFNIRQSINDNIQLVYDVMGLSSDSLELIYNVSKTVSDDLEIKYDVRAKIGDTLQIIYNVLSAMSAVSDTLEIRFNVRKNVSDNVQILYNTRGKIGDTLQIIYNVQENGIPIISMVTIGSLYDVMIKSQPLSSIDLKTGSLYEITLDVDEGQE